jgi:hypothetical protein
MTEMECMDIITYIHGYGKSKMQDSKYGKCEIKYNNVKKQDPLQWRTVKIKWIILFYINKT